MKRMIPFALMAMIVINAQAQHTDIQARAWAASCAACHGTNGHSLGVYISIAGVDKTQLLEKLIAYKKGVLPATVMHQHAKGYTDSELARLANYFSQQKPQQ